MSEKDLESLLEQISKTQEHLEKQLPKKMEVSVIVQQEPLSKKNKLAPKTITSPVVAVTDSKGGAVSVKVVVNASEATSSASIKSDFETQLKEIENEKALHSLRALNRKSKTHKKARFAKELFVKGFTPQEISVATGYEVDTVEDWLGLNKKLQYRITTPPDRLRRIKKENACVLLMKVPHNKGLKKKKEYAKVLYGKGYTTKEIADCVGRYRSETVKD
ncbi:MAG: hypothetical protein GOV15_02190, partial [Candidatus Diapherotrites archaeon]|nr:hypothetical protein [Candidatus Diapherotrites archaeon]